MANILAFGEISDGNLKKTSFEMVSIGKGIGSVSAVLIGGGATGAGAELGKYGADAVYANDTTDFVPEAISAAIAGLVKDKGFDILIFPHTGRGKEISARVGTLLDAGVVSEAVETKLDGDRLVCKKPVHAGKAFVTLKATSAIQIVTVRPNSHEIKENAGSGAVESIDLDTSLAKATLKNFEQKKSERVPLTEADVVVSGGRGLKGPENFKLVEDLADLLGAGTGATRAIVDAGWVDHTLQIGQTGVTVSPNLYIGLGISGAIQHLAGMGSSKYIVAVNKDPDAPIFKVSTFGVVDDLFKIVPPMQDALKEALGK